MGTLPKVHPIIKRRTWEIIRFVFSLLNGNSRTPIENARNVRDFAGAGAAGHDDSFTYLVAILDILLRQDVNCNYNYKTIHV